MRFEYLFDEIFYNLLFSIDSAPNVYRCVPKNSDKCFQENELFETWHCGELLTELPLCREWAKDTRRCCPEICKSDTPFTKDKCQANKNKGECTYPNEAQCGKMKNIE